MSCQIVKCGSCKGTYSTSGFQHDYDCPNNPRHIRFTYSGSSEAADGHAGRIQFHSSDDLAKTNGWVTDVESNRALDEAVKAAKEIRKRQEEMKAAEVESLIKEEKTKVEKLLDGLNAMGWMLTVEDLGREQLLELLKRQTTRLRHAESENQSLRRYRRNARASMRNMQRAYLTAKEIACDQIDEKVAYRNEVERLREELQRLKAAGRVEWDLGMLPMANESRASHGFDQRELCAALFLFAFLVGGCLWLVYLLRTGVV